MNNQVINLKANNSSPLTFPHFISPHNITPNTDECVVVMHPEKLLKHGDYIGFWPQDKGKPILTISATREAKGDWTAYGFTPLVATITF